MTELCHASSRWDCIFIYIFRTFEARMQADIAGLGLATNWPLTWVWQPKSCKLSGTSFLGCKVAEPATKSQDVFVPQAKFLNKMKDFFERQKYTWECNQQIFVVVWCRTKSGQVNMIQFYRLLKKKQMTLTHMHNTNYPFNQINTCTPLYFVCFFFLHFLNRKKSFLKRSIH